MHYVIQVSPGAELKTEAQIRERVSRELYSSCFHPTRHIRKKFRGQWKDVHEKLLPGYVFIDSDDVRNFCIGLQKVPALTKLLGRSEEDRDYFAALSSKDVEWLERMMNFGTDEEGISYEVGLSKVEISQNDEVNIISGPLENVKGLVKRINLHRRVAEVEVEFMNRRITVHLGIELVEKARA